MKKQLTIGCAVALLLSGCATTRSGGADPNAVFTGAAIGGQVGGAIGGLIGDNNHGWHGAYRGSSIGSLVGTLAGAALGGAISSSKQREANQQTSTATPYNEAIDALRIRRIRFIDDNGNHLIEPNESSKIVFDVVNEGNQTARNVVPVVRETTGAKHITISPSVMVEEIHPGEGVKYTATLSAGKRLKAGSLTIRLAIADEYGQEYDWSDFSIETGRNN